MKAKNILSVMIMMTSLLAISPIHAQPVCYPGQACQQSLPGEVLREGIGKLMAFVENGGSRYASRLRLFVEREITPYFDFAYMTQLVAGPRYRNMNVQQRYVMQQELQRLFLSAMLHQLSGYNPARVQYLRPRGNPGGRVVTLGIQSFSREGYPIRLNFRMYLGNNGWKVFDVSANGQSALVHFRNYFAQQYRYQNRPRPAYQNPRAAYYR